MNALHALTPYMDLIKAAVLGIVEGFTEFLPVSSTGHLLLMEHFLGWGDSSFGKSFAILIQLGAILALLSIYFGRLWSLATHMFTRMGGDALRHRRAGRLSAGGGDRRTGGARSSSRRCSTCASSASCSSSAALSCCGSTGWI